MITSVSKHFVHKNDFIRKRIRDAAFFFNHYACYLCSNIIKTSKLC